MRESKGRLLAFIAIAAPRPAGVLTTRDTSRMKLRPSIAAARLHLPSYPLLGSGPKFAGSASGSALGMPGGQPGRASATRRGSRPPPETSQGPPGLWHRSCLASRLAVALRRIRHHHALAPPTRGRTKEVRSLPVRRRPTHHRHPPPRQPHLAAATLTSWPARPPSGAPAHGRQSGMLPGPPRACRRRDLRPYQAQRSTRSSGRPAARPPAA